MPEHVQQVNPLRLYFCPTWVCLCVNTGLSRFFFFALLCETLGVPRNRLCSRHVLIVSIVLFSVNTFQLSDSWFG